MAIQNRRGDFKDFDPYKMVPGEFAIITSGDPNSKDGTSVYHCFAPGVVKRLTSYEDLKEQVDSSVGEIIDERIEEALKDLEISGGGATEEQIGQIETNKQNIENLQQTVDNIKIPAKTSELNNDSGFITSAVNDLANYYLKTETYSRTELDNKLSAIPKFAIEVVSSLPASNISVTTVYLVPSGNEQDNLYTEYIYVNGKWEYLGKQSVDLTGYVQRTELSNYYTAEQMDALLETIRNSIPTKISQLADDATHRTVTDTEKQTWNNKANTATTLAGYGITDGATKEQFEQLSQEISELSVSVTPQQYGAVADGVTDDTKAIKQCLAENDYIYFPRGRYRMTEPLEINRDNIIIVGEDGETYGKTRIEFESCDGVVFNRGRNITFNGISVWATDQANEYCAFKFNASNSMHKTRISNCMIWYFKYGISESLGDTPCIVWNCNFKHIKTFNVEYAIYLGQTDEATNHFGLLFEDFYSDNGKIYLSYGKYTFLNCNFGIRTKNYMCLQYSCFTTWINCNFECDETISFDESIAPRKNHCIELNGKGHLFIGCQFAVKGEQKDGKSVFLIDVKSDLRLLKFVNCYSWTDGIATIWYTSGDYGEAGCITFDGDNMDKPSWSGIYMGAYNTNVSNGLTNAYENYKDFFPDNFLYWEYGAKEIRYYKDEIVYDSHGNDIATRGKPPIKIGAGFYLDFGEIEVTGSAINVTYNRQVDGQVFVAVPPIIDNVPIMVSRDVSDAHKDKTYYARFQIKMWDETSKIWVDNTKSFALKWMKISL